MRVTQTTLIYRIILPHKFTTYSVGVTEYSVIYQILWGILFELPKPNIIIRYTEYQISNEDGNY